MTGHLVQGHLFATAMQGAHANGAHGFRRTPPEMIELLVSLEEWNRSKGGVLDLGCGDGAICRGIAHRAPETVTFWGAVDIRWEAINSLVGWNPGVDVRADVLDALQKEWPEWIRRLCQRVVTNPPWSVLLCATCGRQWKARQHGGKCVVCKKPGLDLAIEMVRSTMRQLPESDIWVLHNADWPFHAERCKFFQETGIEGSAPFVRANEEVLAGRRVAYGKPAGPTTNWKCPDHGTWKGKPECPVAVCDAEIASADGKVQKHNRPSVWWRFQPRSRFSGQVIRYHS